MYTSNVLSILQEGGKGEPGCPQEWDRAGWVIGVFQGWKNPGAWLLMALTMADLMWDPPTMAPGTPASQCCQTHSNRGHRDCTGATKWLQRSWTRVPEGLQSSCNKVAKVLQKDWKDALKGLQIIYTESLQSHWFRGHWWDWGLQSPPATPRGCH